MGKRKLYTGNRPIGGGAIKSRRVAREVTGQYHQLRNELDVLQQVKGGSSSSARVRELEQSLEALGGTDAYQQASIISTRHFKTSRWVLQMIREHIYCATPEAQRPTLQLLEVGAINTDLQHVSRVHTRAIDLHSQHPSIETLDFFDLPPEQSFHVVVCSMVVNCVTEAGRRGEMLARLIGHLRPTEKAQAPSLLLLALPSRCLSSPQVQSKARFVALLQALGLELLAQRETPKVTFLTLALANDVNQTATAAPDEPPPPRRKKKEQEEDKGKERDEEREEGREWVRACRARLLACDVATLRAFRQGSAPAPEAARHSGEFAVLVPAWLWP